MNSYTIEGEDRKFSVKGTIKDGKVTVKTDSETYVFRPEQGDFKTGATSARLVMDDGSYIDEGAVSQTIRLSDGTKIEKGAVTKKVILPNGDVIKSKDIDEDSNDSKTVKTYNGDISIKFSSSSSFQNSSSNVDIKINQRSKSSNGFNIQVQQFDEIFKQLQEQHKKSKKQKKQEKTVSSSDVASALTPGFFTLAIIVFGILYSSTFALFVGVMIYLSFALPVITEYAVQSLASNKNAESDKETSETVTDEEEHESEVEELKEEYMETDMTLEEFEEELEDIFEEDKELELELN